MVEPAERGSGGEQTAAALDEAAQSLRVGLLDDAGVREHERRLGGVERELARAFAQPRDGVAVASQQLGEGGEPFLGRGVRRGRRPALTRIRELDRTGRNVQPDEDRDEDDHDALGHAARARSSTCGQPVRAFSTSASEAARPP